MNQLVNQHNTLDQNQIDVLTSGLKMKQQYRQQENDIVNQYLDNVYKPMESYFNSRSEAINEVAKSTEKTSEKIAAYK
jgi:hypothetical protein